MSSSDPGALGTVPLTGLSFAHTPEVHVYATVLDGPDSCMATECAVMKQECAPSTVISIMLDSGNDVKAVSVIATGWAESQ